MEINPHIAAGIRKALKDLDAIGAGHVTDYWIDELHQVNGYPIPERWNAMTLRQIQTDISRMTAQVGEDTP